MTTPVISQLRLHSWSREITKGFIASSVWGQFSNINVRDALLPKDKEKKVPETAIHYLNVEFKKGEFKTTIPLVKSLVKPGVGGRQAAKGTGENPETRFSRVFWNRTRKVINADREGVDRKSIEYINLAKKQYMLLGDWFKQDEDWAFQRAICEGYDIYLTEQMFWDGHEFQLTPAATTRIHPNVSFLNMTRSTMPALYDSSGNLLANGDYTNNVTASLRNLSADDKFNFDALTQIMEYARGHIKPIEKGSTQYIVLLSYVQAAQLRKDERFLDINMAADKRGEDNRALSGVLGTWQGFTFIEDRRSPIFDIASKSFKYVTYENGTTVDRFSGLASLPRLSKGAALSSSGTCEVARVLGNAAIGIPMVDGSNLSFKDEPTDFEEFNEICGRKNSGHCRLDFYNGTETTLENESSALFFTGTPATFTQA